MLLPLLLSVRLSVRPSVHLSFCLSVLLFDFWLVVCCCCFLDAAVVGAVVSAPVVDVVAVFVSVGEALIFAAVVE